MNHLAKFFFVFCIILSAKVFAESGNPTFNELKNSLTINMIAHKTFLKTHKVNIIRLSKKQNKYNDYSYAICGHLSVIKNDLEQIQNSNKKLLWDLTRLEIMVRVSEYNENKEINDLVNTSNDFDFPLLDLQINNKMPIEKLEDAHVTLEKIIIEYDALSTIACRQDTIERFSSPKVKHQFYKNAFNELTILIEQYEQKVLELPNSKHQKVFVARQLNLKGI